MCAVLCHAVLSTPQDEKAVTAQLDEALDKGGWLVFSEAGEAQKGSCFSSLQDFREHAVTKQLVSWVAGK